jgi:hypothetical protein
VLDRIVRQSAGDHLIEEHPWARHSPAPSDLDSLDDVLSEHTGESGNS